MNIIEIYVTHNCDKKTFTLEVSEEMMPSFQRIFSKGAEEDDTITFFSLEGGKR